MRYAALLLLLLATTAAPVGPFAARPGAAQVAPPLAPCTRTAEIARLALPDGVLRVATGAQRTGALQAAPAPVWTGALQTRLSRQAAVAELASTAISHTRSMLGWGDQLPPTRLKIEPHYLVPSESGAELGGRWKDGVAEEIARRLEAPLGTLDQTLVCDGLPGTCHLLGADALFAVSRPVVSGDAAEILVSGWYQTETGVAHLLLRDHLKRQDRGEWILQSEEVLVVT